MTTVEAIIIGVVQGLAEFLPISSSGHIVLTQFLLGVREVGQAPPKDIALEIVLHMGTLVSVIIFFRKPLWRLTQSLYTKEMKEQRVQIVWLALASVPATIAYILFKTQFKAAYNDPVLTSGLLIVTGCILFVPSWLKKMKDSNKPIGFWTAVVMGCFQAIAILPGISRSGSTIVGGLLMNGKPEKVAEFSFLMSIPAIAGGFVFNLKDMIDVQMEHGGPEKATFGQGLEAALKECFQSAYVSGAAAAAIVGLLAIYLVMGAVRRGKLTYFSYYCFVAGVSGMVYFSLVN